MSRLNSDPGDIPKGNSKESYALSGKIMLTAIVVLFTVVVIMVGLHLYARWYVLRARRRQLRRHRRTNLVFYVDPTNPNATVTVPAATRGLDASVLKSLPVFVYSAETHPETIECAVCLSEFEENEKGRLLPKCNHSFHIDCIDMWFHSHSTCPLCRSPVEPSGSLLENPAEVVISVRESAEPEVGSSSSMCSTCQHEELEMNHGRSSSTASTSSFGARRKPSTIQVPRRNGSFGGSDDGLGTESPASQAFKSPGSRILSLKRILSRTLSPSSASCGTVIDSELDVERGRDETSQPSRVQTPRS